MSTPEGDPAIEDIAGRLAEHGYVVAHHFIGNALVGALRSECDRLEREGCFRPAGIGSGGDARVREDIRGDRICWIEPGTSVLAVTQVLARFDALRLAVNRAMFLGLLDFECHFARYVAGAGYQRHYDQFRGNNRRQLTVTLYLNEGWRDDYGGQLRVYLDDQDPGRVLQITPTAGTMVAFLSADYAHEVMPCSRTRLSMTGWFLRRD